MNAQAYEERKTLPHFQKFAKTFEEEQLVAKTKHLKMSDPPMGFMREELKVTIAKGGA